MAQWGYKSANGTYIDCAASPRPVEALDEQAAPWRDLGTGFTQLGFSTKEVCFVYQVSGATEKGFVVEAIGDCDGDGNRILYVGTERVLPPHVIGTDAGDAALTLALGTRGDMKD